jgi:2-iminobutanoate/2-iminopropanoate deaminase
VHDTGIMGTRVGNKIWSCGIGGDVPGGTEKAGGFEHQLEQSFENLKAFMSQAGGTLDDVGSVTVLVRHVEDEHFVARHWDKVWPNGGDHPARHISAFGLSPTNQGRIQLHVTGSLGAD